MNRRAKWLFRTALISVMLLLMAGFLINSNGDFPHLGQTPSLILTVLLFTLGIVCSVALFILEKSQRIAATLFLSIIAALVAPALLCCGFYQR